MIRAAAWCIQLYTICNCVPNAFLYYMPPLHAPLHAHFWQHTCCLASVSGVLFCGSIRKKLGCCIPVSLPANALGTDVLHLFTDYSLISMWLPWLYAPHPVVTPNAHQKVSLYQSLSAGKQPRAEDCCNWLTAKLNACGAERKAGVSNQPYGVGPLETCPPAGSPFSDPPSSMSRLPSEDPKPAPKSPPKQIVSVLVSEFPVCRQASGTSTVSLYLIFFGLCRAHGAIWHTEA